MITGGTYQGDTGAPQMSAWPAYAPRLGAGLRNVRFANAGNSFNLGNIAGKLALPVGFGGLTPSIVPSARLPELAPTPAPFTQTPVPPAIDRRDLPPVKRQNWFDYWDQQALRPGPDWKDSLGGNVIRPDFIEAAKRGAGWAQAQGNIINQKENKSMDLGALITDLGSKFIDAKFAPPNPAFLPAAGAAAAAAAAAGAAGIGLPFVDVIPGMPDAKACGGRPVYKYHCGEYKWVYPKRRRRKALATQSDLRGLAALKGVLGQGKAFEVWIATHS